MHLRDFFRQLDQTAGPVDLETLTGQLKDLEIDLEALRDRIVFSPTGYCRNRLHEGPSYQALILCWKPGQRSPIHDHRGSACGVRVLMGTATEIPFKRIEGGITPMPRRQLPTGGVCASCDADIHEIANLGDDDLVTLHIYSPALERYHVYSPSGESRLIASKVNDPVGAAPA